MALTALHGGWAARFTELAKELAKCGAMRLLTGHSYGT